MGVPKVDANIEETWAVTYNNEVGAESRGAVAVVGASPLNITAIPVNLGGNDCINIDEILEYADGNGNDVVTLDLDGEIETDHMIVVPDGITLQVADGRDFKIILTDIVPVRDGYAYDVMQDENCASSFSEGKEICYVRQGTNTIVRLSFNQGRMEWDEVVRPTAAGGTYRGLAYDVDSSDEWGAVDQGAANTLEILEGDTLIQTATDVQSNIVGGTKFRVVFDNYNDRRLFYLTHRNSGVTNLIRRVRHDDLSTAPAWVQEDLTAYIQAGDSFIAGWEVTQHGINHNEITLDPAAHSFINAIAWTANYKTYLYSTVEFDENSFLSKIDGILTTFVYMEDFEGQRKLNFLGGNKIVTYNGNRFVTEHTFDTGNATTVYCKFIPHRNESNQIVKLYFAIEIQGSIEIWERQSGGNWVFIRRIVDQLFPVAVTDDNTGRQSVLFMDFANNRPYHSSKQGGPLFMRQDSSLIGLVVENRNNLQKVYDSTYTHEVISGSFSGYLSTDNNVCTISYCSIYDDISANGVSNIWQIDHCHIKTRYSCLFYDNPLTEFTGNCEYNLLRSTGGWSLYYGNNYIYNAPTEFANNTCDGLGGIHYNSSQTPVFVNNIVMAVNIALYTTIASTFYITYSLVYGLIEDLSVVDGTCSVNINPSFVDAVSGDYRLQHRALGFPRDSFLVGIGDDSNDLGCYNATYTNLGEINSYTLEIDGYKVDKNFSWEYAKLESTKDDSGNTIKYTGPRRRIINLDGNLGETHVATLAALDKMFIEKSPLRLYLNGDEHFDRFFLSYELLDDEDFAKMYGQQIYQETFIDLRDLTYSFMTSVFHEDIEYEMVAEAPAINITGDIVVDTDQISNIADTSGLRVGYLIEDPLFPKGTKIRYIVDANTILVSKDALGDSLAHAITIRDGKFLPGFLRDFYLILDDGGTTYSFKIDENDEYTLYLKNTDEILVVPGDGSYSSYIDYVYVTYDEQPQFRNNVTNNIKNTTGDINSIKLISLEDKYELQI